MRWLSGGEGGTWALSGACVCSVVASHFSAAAYRATHMPHARRPLLMPVNLTKQGYCY